MLPTLPHCGNVQARTISTSYTLLFLVLWSFREFTVFKEKPHDIADALLSLKHAVVHPQLSGQLSPPVMGQAINPSHQMSGQNPQLLTYTVSHQPLPGGYPSNPINQYSHHQYADPGQPSPQTQGGMFPSMSVNVSMSMNVGVPQSPVGGSYNPVHQQWTNSTQHPASQYGHGNHPATPIHHNQYSGYGAQSPHAYGQSYAFGSPDMRGVPDGRSMFHKHTDSYKQASRICSVGHFKRMKFVSGRQTPFQPNADSSKVNLCRICGKTYARPSTLKTHMRTHSGEKPYKCSTCSKSFSQAANLTAHVRTHSGEKPFRCPCCDRRFSQSSSVTTHMRTHSGERPYRCRMCKKAFSDSSTLTKHHRIHSGEKPYQCKLCLLRFSQSGNLNRHMRVHANTV